MFIHKSNLFLYIYTKKHIHSIHNIIIILLAPPIFLATNRRVQFGQYGRDLNITVVLYSKLDIIQLNVSKLNKTLKPNITMSRFHTPDLFRGLDVRVSEITVVFSLGLATKEDFVNYTIDACNREGCNAYYVYLKSASTYFVFQVQYEIL